MRPPGSQTTLAEAQRRIVKGIEAVERRSGGHRPIVDLLLAVAAGRLRARRESRGPVRILDAAAGSGWLLELLWGRARMRGIAVDLTAGDLNPALVGGLAERFLSEEIPCEVRVQDARCVPAARATWDVAVLAYTLHHLAPDDAARCLRELDRVSGGGLVVVDIDRNILGLTLLPVIVTMLAPGAFPYVVHDGVVSVRRAYTRRELRTLLDRTGLGGRYRVAPLPTRHPQRFVANAILPI